MSQITKVKCDAPGCPNQQAAPIGWWKIIEGEAGFTVFAADTTEIKPPGPSKPTAIAKLLDACGIECVTKIMSAWAGKLHEAPGVEYIPTSTVEIHEALNADRKS